MHCKWPYKIAICLTILGELIKVFPKSQGRKYYPENFRWNLTIYDSENFSDSSLHHSLEFQVSFLYEK